MWEMIRSGFMATLTGKPAPVIQDRKPADLEKFPSVRGIAPSDLERFPKVTFGSEPVHLKTGMHPGVSTLFQRRRRGPYI